MSEFFQIAIDGPTASGKGTAARGLARKLGFLCLDTGALYRGMTIYFLDNGLDAGNEADVLRAVRDADINVRCVEGNTLVFLNEVNITPRLRDNEVSNRAFSVAKVPEIRVKVREIQQAVARRNNLVCEGRDIGSVVFPGARFKFFITADIGVRVNRRHMELLNRGEDVEVEKLTLQIKQRDSADMNREHSPLKVCDDAVLIDASTMNAYDVIGVMAV